MFFFALLRLGAALPITLAFPTVLLRASSFSVSLHSDSSCRELFVIPSHAFANQIPMTATPNTALQRLLRFEFYDFA